MLYGSFLAQVVKISNAFIIFMYACNVNVISIRYEASSRDTYHWKNALSKNTIVNPEKKKLRLD